MSDRTDNHQIHKNAQALLDMTLAMAATCDLDKLLKMVVDYSMELLDAERATLFLYDNSVNELYSRIAEGTDEFRIPADSGIAGAAATSLKIVNIPDAYEDTRFNRTVDANTGYRTRSILSCPLTNYNGQLEGVLQILNKRTGPFDRADEALAEAFSAQAGVALQRAHLLDEYLEKQRLEDSLMVAKEIQQKLLPNEAPCLRGFDIVCWSRPCDETGGDYCDFMFQEEDRLMVTLGDVSGHGVGPALISCATRAMLRALVNQKIDINIVFAKVNSLITQDLADNRFVTAFLGILHGDTGTLRYCSAGQGPLLWLHAADGTIETLAADGIPVGIISDFVYDPPRDAKMATGDIFVLLTDGFYEWARSDGEMFGIERIAEIVQKFKAQGAAEILVEIKSAVEGFAQTKQADDLTAIIIKKITDPEAG